LPPLSLLPLPVLRLKTIKTSIFIYGTRNINANQIHHFIDKSKSAIAHKNKKRTTAGTH
jgi:hypothetical protein